MNDGEPMPIDVAKSVLATQAKAQVRIALAAVAGGLVGKHILPAGIVNDDLLSALTALAIYGGVSAWQWARVRLQHSRLWSLAINPDVPNALIRPAAGAVADTADQTKDPGSISLTGTQGA